MSSNIKDETLPAKPTTRNEPAAQPPVLFRSGFNSRTFVLNRPDALNALNRPMLELLAAQIEEWEKSPRCEVIIGTGNVRAFCAGGDVKSIVQSIEKGEPEPGVQFFKEEFELFYALSKLQTAYVAILDGTTLGGGVGLSIQAPFRVATENTVFGMPETKIGYNPDVGASFFLPRLDGAIGTYLGLTGESLQGREVYESGIATHYMSSARIPSLLERLDELFAPQTIRINDTLDEFYSERLGEEEPTSIAGTRRKAIDEAFSGATVEEIMESLRRMESDATHAERTWAGKTLEQLEMRSPTSLRIAHEALRRGKSMTLGEALTMEMGIASAYCRGASPDFVTGVKAVLMDKSKSKGRPGWTPNKLADITLDAVTRDFFSADSRYLREVPETTFSRDALKWTEKEKEKEKNDPFRYCLPSEEVIGQVIRGEHSSSSSTAYTTEEVISVVRGLFPKGGVEDKVREVVNRRCTVVPRSGMEEAHVRWNH